MTNHAPEPISAYLSRAPHARVLAHVGLGAGCSATVWRNHDAHVRYDDPQGHTFSLYTRGGAGSRRLDPEGARAGRGWQGAFCLMPQGQPSEWQIDESFEFVHLHLPDDELRRIYAQTCDRDSRLLQPVELTYVEAQALAAPFHALHDATRAADRLAAEAAMHEILGLIVTDSRYGRARPVTLTGGLAPRRLRLVLDYVEAHLDQPLHLQDLAALADLSPFHFQRSFRASCGVSPHRWIAARRIASARTLLAQDRALAEVALDCGFDSQSHFTRMFKAAVGMTPGRYRAALRGDPAPAA